MIEVSRTYVSLSRPSPPLHTSILDVQQNHSPIFLCTQSFNLVDGKVVGRDWFDVFEFHRCI